MDDLLIYFEPQAAALCGVHALNALLQGPYFSEVDLAQIAHELDQLEHQLMREAGVDSHDFLKFMAEESGNVADHGMFSIQVLSKALEVWGLRAISINSPEAAAAKADPTHEHAFICNLREHWFTIREVYGQWWNLNSVFSAPEPLSQFYLSAFLGTLQDQGYSIFVIRGQLPHEPHPDSVAREGPGKWFTAEEARTAAEQAKQLKQQGFLQAAYKGVLGKASALGNTVRLLTSGSKRPHDDGGLEGGDDPDLARALAASLAEFDEQGAGPSRARQPSRAAADDEDADLAAAIAASLAEHAQQREQQQPPPSGEALTGPGSAEAPAAEGTGEPVAEGEPMSVVEEDAAGQLAEGEAAPAADVKAAGGPEVAAKVPPQELPAVGGPALPELGPEPDVGEEGVVEVGLRLPDGSRCVRRLLSSDTVGHLAAWAAAQGVDMGRHRLGQRFPRRVFEDLSLTLQDAGIATKEMINVEQL